MADGAGPGRRGGVASGEASGALCQTVWRTSDCRAQVQKSRKPAKDDLQDRADLWPCGCPEVSRGTSRERAAAPSTAGMRGGVRWVPGGPPVVSSATALKRVRATVEAAGSRHRCGCRVPQAPSRRRSVERSRAEPSRTELSQAVPRCKPRRAGLSRTVAWRGVAGRVEPSRAEPSRAEPSQAKPSRAEPSRAEPSRAEPSRAEPSRAKSSQVEPSRAVPCRAVRRSAAFGSLLISPPCALFAAS